MLPDTPADISVPLTWTEVILYAYAFLDSQSLTPREIYHTKNNRTHYFS